MVISGVLRIGALQLPWLECSVKHSNALVRHESPGIPGQIVESTGRRGYDISASVVLSGDWYDTLDRLLRAVDLDQIGDLTLADGRVVKVAFENVVEQWRLDDGVRIRIDMTEDARADLYPLAVPADAPLRTAPEAAKRRGWGAAAAALETLRELMDAATPPTMGELVAAYGTAGAFLVQAEEAALEIEDRGGFEDAALAVVLRAAPLAALPLAAREMIDASRQG